MKIRTDHQVAEINLQAGAALESLILSNAGRKREVISSSPGYLYSSSFLFPFPNRLADGHYQIDGKTYHFPCNDFGNPNALHGFIHDRKFDVLEQSPGMLKAGYTYTGELEYFPFPFMFRCTYVLEPSAITIRISVTNIGTEPMPFGIGWHPYFYVEESVDNAGMSLPHVEQHELGQYSRPTGKVSEYSLFNSNNSLEKIELDDCFERTDNRSCYVNYPDGSMLEIWQDEQFPFIQIYTPGDRKAIAIEPMSCGVDAWNRAEVMPTLEAGKTFQGSFGLRFS